MIEKLGFSFLLKNLFFNPFLTQKHCKNRDKPIYDLEKKKGSKN